ncbi:hypothetical protein Tco_0917383 [Tanacetum coccineum]
MPLSTTFKTSPLISPSVDIWGIPAVTFGTQRSRSSVWSPVTISCGISSSSVLPLVWLLILVVPGGVIRLSFVVSLTFSLSVDLLVHEFSGELNGILHSFWLSCHHTAMDCVGQATDIFPHLIYSRNIRSHIMLVLGNYGYSVLHGIAWAASGVVVLTWEFHHIPTFRTTYVIPTTSLSTLKFKGWHFRKSCASLAAMQQ